MMTKLNNILRNTKIMNENGISFDGPKWMAVHLDDNVQISDHTHPE